MMLLRKFGLMKDKYDINSLHLNIDLFENLQKLSVYDDDIEIYIDEDGDIEIEIEVDKFMSIIKNMWGIDK